MAQSPEYPDLTFRPPKSYTRGRITKPRIIVIHTTEGHEHAQAAEDGAAYDGRRTDGTSAHYFIDPDSVVQCVRTTDTAHTARFTGNTIGIQYELCGRAGQSVKQWGDDASTAILRLAAAQAARDCRRWGIPARRLTRDELRSGAAGFVGHVDCTFAFPFDKGTHTDPGPNFPWDEFMALVRAELSGEEMDQETFDARYLAALNNPKIAARHRALPWQYAGGGLDGNDATPEGNRSTLAVLNAAGRPHTAAVTLDPAQLDALADRVAARLSAVVFRAET